MRDVFVVNSYHETEIIDPAYPHPIIEASAEARARVFLAGSKTDPNFKFPEEPDYKVPETVRVHLERAASEDYEPPRKLPVIVVELIAEESGQSSFTYRIHAPSRDDYKTARGMFKPGSKVKLGWERADG